MAAPLGVCVLPEPEKNRSRTIAYPQYIHEILAHAGLCYERVELADLGDLLPQLRLLVTVGETPLPEYLRASLRDWVRQGGGWVSVGGLCGLEDLLGAQAETPAYPNWGGGAGTLGEGYLQAEVGEHPALAHLEIPLHFFNGIPIEATEAAVLARVLDAHQRSTARHALLENTVGQGRCLLIAPDVTGTVVFIQQGRAITRDGVPAPDGTAPLCDGVLKSDDGGVLDWSFDRQPVPGVPGLHAFLQPIADQWRELLLRAVFYLADTLAVVLPVLWLYPRNLPALAHLSHDTDSNDPEKARRLLKILEEMQVHGTWCVILPGYPPEIMDAIRDAGHELATHYDALDHPWSEEEFDRQWRELCALFAPEVPVSNKNHYTRWEGDTEFFDWCARRGIRLDQSKGASKTGDVGFNFGTCHPYFPLAPDGRRLNVLELPMPTQDLEVVAPAALGEVLLKAAERHHGVLHLLFHPAHTSREDVAQALRDMVSMAKAQGMEWWTAKQLDAWERGRRQAQWQDYRQEGSAVQVTLRAGEPLREATLLWLARSGGRVRVNGVEQTTKTVNRWGFAFQAATVTLPAYAETTIRVEESTDYTD